MMMMVPFYILLFLFIYQCFRCQGKTKILDCYIKVSFTKCKYHHHHQMHGLSPIINYQKYCLFSFLPLFIRIRRFNVQKIYGKKERKKKGLLTKSAIHYSNNICKDMYLDEVQQEKKEAQFSFSFFLGGVGVGVREKKGEC